MCAPDVRDVEVERGAVADVRHDDAPRLAKPLYKAGVFDPERPAAWAGHIHYW